MRRLSDIDLRLIRIFCTIVDCNGFSGAQIVCNMGQSTLSTHLASLEAKLGSKLCRRGRAGFRLTPAGEETYAAAQELLASIIRFEATMDRVHRRPTARLRIGIIDSITTFDSLDLPGTLARFAAVHPEVLVELETDTPSGLQSSLLQGRRDVIVGPALQPLPRIAYSELALEEHRLYCGRDHPWFSRPDTGLTQADFLQASFSVRNPDKPLRGANPPVVRGPSTDGDARMASGGAGISSIDPGVADRDESSPRHFTQP